MDPNALYRVMLRLLPDALNGDTDAAEQLAEGFSNLNHWLANGGSLPDAWKKNS